MTGVSTGNFVASIDHLVSFQSILHYFWFRVEENNMEMWEWKKKEGEDQKGILFKEQKRYILKLTCQPTCNS